MLKRWTAAVLCAAAAACSSAPPPLAPALPDFCTVETAKTTKIQRGAGPQAEQPGYLGLHVVPDTRGRLVVADAAVDSPAAKAGIQAGDVVVAVGGEEPGSPDGLRDLIQERTPGEAVAVEIERQGETLEVTATVAGVSRPRKAAERQAVLGLSVGEPGEGEGVPIQRLTPRMPAEQAGLKVGDVLLSVDGVPMTAASRLTETVGGRAPGDTVALVVRRQGKVEELKVQLVADPSARGDGYFRGGSIFRKDVYRLALIPIEYPDVKHNPKVGLKDWEEQLFSKGTYSKKSNVTGQPVHGSLNDYYQEVSCGALRIEGKVFDWVTAAKNRMDYSPGTGTGNANRTALLTEAMEKLLARDGKDALQGFDGVFFFYAGDRVQTSRGGLYWPHRGNVQFQGKRWSYFIMQEGGARMSSISVMAHEFGHMLGLPDLYARPENPGSEGLGVWCAMSNENGGGRPQHFGAWCKEQLGWLAPALIDPTVKQRLVLGPVEGSKTECFKVLVRPDGSEYFLLENRRKTGFDLDLPAEGLLVWRVVRGRPILEESHGVDGPSGPRSYPREVPYPSEANSAFTPHTTPSSRSQLGGGLPVSITNIRRLPDGRVSFHIGFDYD
jgi:M6 family metalloprotease-like protein